MKIRRVFLYCENDMRESYLRLILTTRMTRFLLLEKVPEFCDEIDCAIVVDAPLIADQLSREMPVVELTTNELRNNSLSTFQLKYSDTSGVLAHVPIAASRAQKRGPSSHMAKAISLRLARPCRDAETL